MFSTKYSFLPLSNVRLILKTKTTLDPILNQEKRQAISFYETETIITQ